MKSLLTVFCVTAIGLFVSAGASAGMLEVEPYLGYQFLGSVGTSAMYSSNTNSAFQHLGVGLRATVKFLDMFYVGPDFSWYQGLSATQPDLPTTAGVKVTNGDQVKLGLVAGVNLPMSFRLWVGYNFLDYLNSTFNGNAVVPGLGQLPMSGNRSLSGSSFKIGAGYSIFSYLNLNVEIFVTSFGATTNQTITIPALAQQGMPTSVAANMPAQSSNQLFITLSAPLSLM